MDFEQTQVINDLEENEEGNENENQEVIWKKYKMINIWR